MLAKKSKPAPCKNIFYASHITYYATFPAKCVENAEFGLKQHSK